MGMIAIYDDRIPVPDEARAFVGIERFSRLVFRKRTLFEHAKEVLGTAGVERTVAITSNDEAEDVADEVLRSPERQRVIYLPSCIAFPNPEAARICIRKFAYSDENFALSADPASSAPPILAMGPKAAASLLDHRDLSHWRGLMTDGQPKFHWADNKARLMDLTVRGRLIEFMSTTFDARSFNRITQNEMLVTKRSSDVEKMRREYLFYEQLDGPLRMFFLQPLAFREGPGWAEYQTERLFIPDVAVQWIHRSFDHDSFANLLARLRAFLAMRPVKSLSQSDGIEAVNRLYVGKVEDRLEKLRASPISGTVDALLNRCSGMKGTQALLERFRALWQRLGGARRHVRLAVSHGDLCFSNILYHRQSQQLKFIDPRGADCKADVYMDEYYDLAKLSHSILGLYDLINHDLAELRLDRDLRLDLSIDASDLLPLQEAFRAEVSAMGFDIRLVRLYEASLFLSMVPLHADVPKKVVAFLITASRIMDELER